MSRKQSARKLRAEPGGGRVRPPPTRYSTKSTGKEVRKQFRNWSSSGSVCSATTQSGGLEARHRKKEESKGTSKRKVTAGGNCQYCKRSKTPCLIKLEASAPTEGKEGINGQSKSLTKTSRMAEREEEKPVKATSCPKNRTGP